jgi:hypothetical protein
MVSTRRQEEALMSRALIAGALLALFTSSALACQGQTGKVILEDKFADDAGGWDFDKTEEGVLFKAPGVVIALNPVETKGRRISQLNQTFNATTGDFCVEASFPPDAAALNAYIGVVFFAVDYKNFWQAVAVADGQVILHKQVNGKLSEVFKTTAKNVAKTGPTDVNSVRAVVKDGTITVFLNGQKIKSVRAAFPTGELKFGFMGGYDNAATKPTTIPIHAYKATATE